MARQTESPELDIGEQRRLAQLIDQYKSQLELALPVFKNLLRIRGEIETFCRKHSRLPPPLEGLK